MMQPRPWTPRDDRLMRDLYPYLKNSTVARELRRTERAIIARAHKLGLHKTDEFKATNTGRLQPGSVPWNKGIKGSAGLHPKARATQFKPGRKPEEARNYQPIGTLRVCRREGYLERKVTDDGPYPARRWVAEHRLVWEAAHGPIPDGHIVVFRPGMKTAVLEDITLDRLECITRAENLRRNSPLYHSPEVWRLYQLKGAITRQVNRLAREHNERTAP